MKKILLIALGLFALSSGSASAAIQPNPWLDRNFLNIAHQGGEDESPSNTMYALKSAIREGHADMLELDVQLTSDGHLVVIHDDTYTRTACLPSLCPGPNSSVPVFGIISRSSQTRITTISSRVMACSRS